LQISSVDRFRPHIPIQINPTILLNRIPAYPPPRGPVERPVCSQVESALHVVEESGISVVHHGQTAGAGDGAVRSEVVGDGERAGGGVENIADGAQLVGHVDELPGGGHVVLALGQVPSRDRLTRVAALADGGVAPEEVAYRRGAADRF